MIRTHIAWFIIALVMFNWGYTEGGYAGAETQASYTHFSLLRTIDAKGNEIEPAASRECVSRIPEALHQYTPFPFNLVNALGYGPL